jgi:pimeloyl-ACP methyl ester carboxylesterase
VTASDAGSTLRLPDGRRLGYAEFGDPRGRPLMFFHGFPGCRFSGSLLHEAAQRAAVRVVCPDRPGWGGSDYMRDRTFGHYPSDVLSLAGELGWDRFAVAGISGGGPYAAVCAHAIPERLTSTSIISGIGPLDAQYAAHGAGRLRRLPFEAGHRLPRLVWLTIPALAAAHHRPEWALAVLMRTRPAADRRVVRRPEVQSAMVRSLREALRQGTRGAAHDLRLYVRPWGFRLEDIRARVRLYHGDLDSTVPVAMARYQADVIPSSTLTLFPGEGHLAALDHLDEILTAVI